MLLHRRRNTEIPLKKEEIKNSDEKVKKSVNHKKKKKQEE